MNKPNLNHEQFETAMLMLDTRLLEIDPLSVYSDSTITNRAVNGLVDAQIICHALADSSGWWKDTETGEDVRTWPKKFFLLWVSAKLALVHSEVSEGLEGLRKDLMDDHLPHRPMLEVELADAAIRILDLAGGLGLDLAGAIIEKLAYNQKRPDHKIENRLAAGGKAV